MKKLGFVLLATALFSCTSSKVVYRIGNDWKPAPAISQMTGTKYIVK